MANLRADNLTGTGGRNAIDGSVFFSTATTDWLKVGSAGDFNFLHNGASDFTAEFWVKPGLGNSRQSVFSTGGNSSTVGFTCRIMEDGATGGSNGYKVLVQYSRGVSGNYLCFLGGTLTVGEWAHVALVFTTSNKQLAVYVNGQLTNSSDLDGTANGTFGSGNFSSSNSTNSLQIGREPYGTTMYLHGSFVSNLRIVEGVTVYTAAFTPPTEKLKPIEGTVLLCCQDSDDATQEATGKTITAYGYFGGDKTEGNLITNALDWTGAASSYSTTMPDNWTAGNGAQVLYETGGTSGGGANRMLRLRNDGSSSYIYQTIPTVIGQKYQIDLWYEAQNSSLAVKWLAGTSANDATNGSEQWTVGSDGNQDTRTGTFNATATTTYITFAIISGTNDASVFVDDIQVKAVNPKAPKFLPPVGIDAGVTFKGDIKMNSQGVMYFPTGDTSQRGRGRGLFCGGYSTPNYKTRIDYVQIQTTGNAQEFGDLSSTSTGEGSACASSTRAVQGGGSLVKTMEYVTIANTSNVTTFGELTVARRSLTALSNNTRGCWAGGTTNPAMSQVIDYVTIATKGDAVTFGDLIEGRRNPAVGSITSTTRGVFAGGNPGSSPNLTNRIDYITIASTGDTTDFGDQVTAMREQAGASSSVRGIVAGGYTSPANLNRIEYITIATTGNASDFGDLNIAVSGPAGTSNSTRALFAGGSNPYINAMEYVTIASTGNAADFGDITLARMFYGGTSDSHGGLS
tara:strand:+ start:1756 stop:3972 length:2217 start_codon:yes stop_codon:yes gene_type:complete